MIIHHHLFPSGHAARRLREEKAERISMGFRKTLIVACGTLLVSFLAACGGQGNDADNDPVNEPVRVVVTFSILGDVVENVGGGSLELTTLVGPNGDTHTFEPAPSDNTKLVEVDVFFRKGLGFEPWVGELCRSFGSGAERVVLTETVDIPYP
jgi:zinc/manganese transport system substrate-binding protein